jgi:hypothetical protein
MPIWLETTARRGGSMRTRGLMCVAGGVALGFAAAWCAWLGLAGFVGYPALVMSYGLGGLVPWAVVPSGSASELLFDLASAAQNIGNPATYVPLIVLASSVAVAGYGTRLLRAVAD